MVPAGLCWRMLLPKLQPRTSGPKIEGTSLGSDRLGSAEIIRRMHEKVNAVPIHLCPNELGGGRQPLLFMPPGERRLQERLDYVYSPLAWFAASRIVELIQDGRTNDD